MATVTVYNAERMKAIEDKSIVSGAVVGDELILTRFDETTVNAGNVRGGIGDQGLPGDVSVAQLNTAIEQAILDAVAAMSAADTVTTAMLQDNAVVGANIANDAVDSRHYVAGSIDAEHLADESVITAKMPNNAVTSAKLSDNSVDSRHYVDGSIDSEHLSFIFRQSGTPTGVTGGIWIVT
jgi:hypothetical protein